MKGWIPPNLNEVGHRLHRLGKGARVAGSRSIEYEIGPFTLMLPVDHPLPAYREAWKLYDEPLRYIADGIRTMHGELRVIDIGANVGDSAAIANVGGTTPVLCIEGDPAYLPFLERNAKELGPHVQVAHCFVGSTEGFVNPEELDRRAGTTSAVRALRKGSAGGVPLSRLDAILDKHPSFEGSRLLKSDTDGYDFEIILSHIEFLAARRPVLFFEYDVVESEASIDDSFRCIDALLEAGYRWFLIFDNFGNLLCSTSSVSPFVELNRYLLSNARFGRAVYYLDVCAIAEPEEGLGEIVRERVQALIRDPVAGDTHETT